MERSIRSTLQVLRRASTCHNHWPCAIIKTTTPHKYRLAFGEFTPEDDFKNESFTLDWGDGTTDEISFDCYITWKDQDPTVHKKLFLNGEEIGMDFTYLLKFVK